MKDRNLALEAYHRQLMEEEEQEKREVYIPHHSQGQQKERQNRVNRVKKTVFLPSNEIKEENED